MKTQFVAALLLLGFALLDTDRAFANAALGKIAKSVGTGIVRVAPAWVLSKDVEDIEDQDVRPRSEGYPGHHSERFPYGSRRYDEPYSYDNGSLRRRLIELEHARYCNRRGFSGYGPDYRNCGR